MPADPPAHAAGFGLAGEFYRSDAVYAADLDRVWRAGWLFAGPGCDAPSPGDFFTLAVGPDPVLVVRGDDGRVRAFHNVCPHRGTVLCDADRGALGKLIVCPYHQWAFTRTGALHSCRGMHADLDRGDLDLRPVHAAEVAGLVFVCLAEAPPAVAPLRETFAAADPHGFDRAKVAHSAEYAVRADWKVVWENNRECYHCAAGHPQYVRANYDDVEAERDTSEARERIAAAVRRVEAYWAAEGLTGGRAAGGLARFPDPADPNPFPVSATRTVLAEGYETESMGGRRVAPLMGRLRSGGAGVLRLRSLPNFWAHASCDHAVLTRLLPAGRGRTDVRVYWLVDAAAREGIDYHLAALLPFWQLTSEQDWRLCELVQRGVESSGYRPGPLSRVREYNVDAFLSWYLARLGEVRP